MHWGSFLSVSSQCLLFLYFWIIAILTRVRWYLTLLLIYISLMISDVEHLFMYLLAICMSYLEKSLFRSPSHIYIYIYILVVVHLLSHVWLFVTPRTAACQAALSFTISWSLLKLVSIELVMPSHHLILCHPLLLVFSNESALCIMWPKVLELQLQLT